MSQASAQSKSSIDYGYTDRSKNDPWPLVVLAGGAFLGLVIVMAILFGGKSK